MFLKSFSLSPAPTPAVACSINSVFQLACPFHSIFQPKIEAVNCRFPHPCPQLNHTLAGTVFFRAGEGRNCAKPIMLSIYISEGARRWRAAAARHPRSPDPRTIPCSSFSVPRYWSRTESRLLPIACKLPKNGRKTAAKKLRIKTMRLVSIICFWNSTVPKFQNSGTGHSKISTIVAVQPLLPVGMLRGLIFHERELRM